MSATSTKLKRPLLRVPVKYAVVGGFLNIVLFFTLIFFDQNPLVTHKPFKLLFDFLMLFVFIFFCIKEFKVYYNQNELRFWQGMTLGFFTFVYIALITSLFLLLYLSASPDMLQDYIAQQTAVIISNKDNIIDMYGEQLYRQWLADMKLVTVADFAGEEFLTKFGLGFFVSLLISVAMRSGVIQTKQQSNRDTNV